MDQFGQLHHGRLGHLPQLGQLGQLGQFCQLDYLGQLGKLGNLVLDIWSIMLLLKKRIRFDVFDNMIKEGA